MKSGKTIKPARSAFSLCVATAVLEGLFILSCSAVNLEKVVTSEVPALSETERRDSFLSEELSIPSPGEFFAAVSKDARPDWGAAGRCGTNLNATLRPQIALNIGALVADGYLAVELQNSQEVKNIGRDILAMARKLNASDSVLSRGRSINQFAENNEWNTLREELEATQNEVKLTLLEQRDEDLLVLISTGTWLRAIQAAILATKSSPASSMSELLRQPGIANYLVLLMQNLPPKTASDPLLLGVTQSLSQIRDIVAKPRGTPLSSEEIQRIGEISANTLQNFCTPSAAASTPAPEPAPEPKPDQIAEPEPQTSPTSGP